MASLPTDKGKTLLQDSQNCFETLCPFEIVSGNILSCSCGSSRLVLESSYLLTLYPPYTSLEESIAHHSRTEVLDGYKCDTCHSGTTSRRNIILRHPSLLVLHLNRNTYVKGRLVKDGKELEFEETFFLKGWHVSQYKLSGVVSHFGGSGSGHYVYFKKRKDSYTLFNDAKVSRVDSVSGDIVLAFYTLV